MQFYAPLILLGLYPILFLYSNNRSWVSLDDLLLPILSVTVVVVVVWFVAYGILRNTRSACIITTIFELVFFTFGRACDILAIRLRLPYSGSIYTICTLAMLVLVYTHLKRHPQSSHVYARFLGILGVSLVVLCFVPIILDALSSTCSHKSTSLPLSLTNTNHDQSRITNMPPNIYMIVLDGCADLSTLEHLYGHNTHTLRKELETRGFILPRRSFANYSATLPSIASLFELEYPFTDLSNSTLQSRIHLVNQRLGQQIDNNRLAHFLKLKGYRYIHIASGTHHTNRNSRADVVFGRDTNYGFLTVLLYATPIGRLFPTLNECFKAANRNHLLEMFDSIAKTAYCQSPKFVFAHIMAPHPPFSFDRHGRPLPFKNVALTEFDETVIRRDLYSGYLEFIEKRLFSAIDSVLSIERNPSLIIIQGDHGPSSLLTAKLRSNQLAIPSDVPPSAYRERLGIFYAYRPVTVGDSVLHGLVTPLPALQNFLNRYLGTNLSVDSDRSYFLWTWKYRRNMPCQFIDVTHIDYFDWHTDTSAESYLTNQIHKGDK